MRQAITPPHLLGQVNATRRVTVFGVQPIGALLGGAFGEAAGLYTPVSWYSMRRASATRREASKISIPTRSPAAS